MKSQVQTISPKKAAEFLKRNVSNRPLSNVWAQRLADAMKAGEWKLNGDAVRFNCNGDLIDGQHRLSACIIAGVPFETYVATGLKHDAFDTIDQGKKRSWADILARRGETHYTCLASAARHVFCLTHPDGYYSMMREGLRGSHLDTVLKDHPELRKAVQFAKDNCKKPTMIAPATCAALYYLMRQSNEKKADEFWTRILTGEGLTKAMAEHCLRNRLIDNLSSTSSLPNYTIVALCIKAWNLAKAGKECRNLKWDDREDFPTIS